ncbi:MAG: ATPase [Candidatus Sulfotelmatobacter sp.]|nr:ATPase [Candidatus Sulfotelmatobacter sp.]
MFLSYYGLREQPFGVTPDPRFLYLSPAHREALASMVYGIEAGRGFIGLIAPPGMGKSTLLFHLLEKFRSSARTAFLFQTQCNSREFMRFLLAELGYECDDNDFVRMHEEFNKRLLQEARAGNRFIVVIDEAQNLEPSVLETVRLLSDFETPRAKLMQIILAGQPELADKLARPGMIQLRQRVSLITGLKPLSFEETNKYIQHRLRAAGYQGGPIFSPEALQRIFDFTAGIPRNINNFCFNCLSLGCALQQRVIDTEIVDEVIADLDIAQHVSQAQHGSPAYGPGAAQIFAGDTVTVTAPLHEAVEQIPGSNGGVGAYRRNGHKTQQPLSPTEARAYMQQIATQLQGFSRVVSDVASGRKSPGNGVDS